MDEEYLQLLMRRLSHDVNASLRASSGFSELLLDKVHSSTKKGENNALDKESIYWLTLIKDEADSAKKKLEVFSQYARLYNYTEEAKAYDLQKLLEDALSNHIEYKNNPQFNIKVDSLPTINCHRVLFYNYFTEIIGNSILHSSGKADVYCKIYSEYKDNQFHLVIEDNGGGLDTLSIDRAMRPFHTLIDDPEHIGMGIPIAKRIVEIHNGKFEMFQNMEKSGLCVVAKFDESIVCKS